MPGVFELTKNADEIKEEPSSIQPNPDAQQNEDSQKTEPVNKEEQVVVLDGPLSKIYTEALNIAYAKEDTGTMLSLINASDDQDRIDGKDSSFIYCVGDIYLNQDELQLSCEHLSKAVNSGKYKKVVLAMECGMNIGNKVQLLDNFSRSIGVEVHYTRGKAVRSVMKKSK